MRLLLATAAAVVALAAPATAGSGEVLVTDATGPVTPVMADHLTDAVAAAEERGAAALLVRLDTPGGLGTSMRDIVKVFLDSEVPVLVWVAPPGAGAASAGYIIASAADVLAMAPGTNIGAATPIDLQGGEVLDKVVNDAVSYAEAVADAQGRDVAFAEEAVRDGASLPAEEAVERGVADFLAESEEEVLAGSDVVPPDAPTERYEPSWTRRLLQLIADPNLAFIFMSIGSLALLYEVAQPGIGAGAAVGITLLVLGMFSLSVLPVSWAGVALLVLAGGLFLAEVFAPGIGVAAAGGTVALVLAGIFLFQTPTGIGVDLAVVIPTAVVVGAAALGAAYLVARSRSRPSQMGADQLVGEEAVVRRSSSGAVQVFVGGAWWRVRDASGRPLEDGTPVTVRAREDLELVVEPRQEERT